MPSWTGRELVTAWRDSILKKNNMEYIGKLYGKIGPNQYFETGKTSEDWDKLQAEVDRYKELQQTFRDKFFEVCIERDKRDLKIEQLEAVVSERGIKLSKTDSEVVGCLHEIADLKKLLKETATRAQLIFPDDADSMKWFDDGADHKKSDFMIRLFEHFGVTSVCDKCGAQLSAGLFCPKCE
jgi:hypothetical protein